MSYPIALFILASLFSFMMGFAVQRSSTCTVAAINEVLNKKTTDRIRSLIETSLWVFMGEVLLMRFDLAQFHLQDWQISGFTVGGAALLGLGAYLNGACMVGTIGRIGNGEWDFFLTIIGFFCGALLIAHLHLDQLYPVAQHELSILKLPDWALGIVFCLIAYRSWMFYKKGLHPYFLTVSLGILFLLLLVIDKAWSYTDLLVDLANIKNTSYLPRLILFFALLIGSIFGGNSLKNIGSTRIVKKSLIAKRFLGGLAMGFATVMLPGSHDALVFLYLPMLLLNAWICFLVMTSTILFASHIENLVHRR